MAPLAENTMVNANVRLKRPLGEGAMGEVWVADHLTLKTEVAVKFISPILINAHPLLVKRFEQEATCAAQIKSPHVVQTFDHGAMEDGTPFIVMEMLEGESIDRMLDASDQLPVSVAAQMLVQVARALSKAHELGIVHRDIKPDNIFATPTEDGLFCKLLDFGIAKQTQLPKVGGLTNPGVMIGTPEYLSPESVMSSASVDYRADLWALAVSVYHVLTGELPFQADTLGRLCVLLLDAKFTPPSQLRPALGEAVDTWMAKALAKDPTKRYRSAREMAREFIRLVSEQGELLEEMSTSDLMTPPPRSLPSEVETFVPATSKAEAHGTLSGSASNLSTPSGIRRRRKSLIGAAAGGAVLAVAGVVALIAFGGDETEASAPAASVEVAPVDEPEEPDVDPADEAEESVAEGPAEETAEQPEETAPSSSTTSAPPARVVRPRPKKPAAAPAPITKPKRKDHGF